MKKLILCSFLALATLALSAQSRWAYGLDVEAGLSGYREVEEEHFVNPQFGDSGYDNRALRRPGVSLGLWTEYLLSRRFGLRMGVNYARMQHFMARESYSENRSLGVTNYSRERTERQQAQLRIPVEAKLYFGNGARPWRAYVSLGAQASYLLSHEISREHLNSGSFGRSETENYENVDLTAHHFGTAARWQLAVQPGVGVNVGRYTVSLQRTWRVTGSSYASNVYGVYVCGTGLPADFLPSYGGNNVAQFNFMSARIAYRLW